MADKLVLFLAFLVRLFHHFPLKILTFVLLYPKTKGMVYGTLPLTFWWHAAPQWMTLRPKDTRGHCRTCQSAFPARRFGIMKCSTVGQHRMGMFRLSELPYYNSAASWT